MQHQFPELPAKVNVVVTRLTYNNWERAELGSWLAKTHANLLAHPRLEYVFQSVLHGYPTPLVRNKALAQAKKAGAHFCVMVDADMSPDVHAADRAIGFTNHPIMRDQVAFLPSALDFALEHPGPCVIGAPYCAGPPEARVLVSRFREVDPGNPNSPTEGVKLESFTRDEAAGRTGFEMVSALPTGLILIDLRIMQVMSPPWFDYEYTTDQHLELASTEDTVFSRNLAYLNIPQYVAWSSWSAHIKDSIVGRPRPYPLGAVPMSIQKTMRDEIAKEQREKRPNDIANLRAMGYLSPLQGDEDETVIPIFDEDSDARKNVPDVQGN